MHGGNFCARSSAVKQHGAILGMQMHRNRIVFALRHSGAMHSIEPGISMRLPRDSGFVAARRPQTRQLARRGMTTVNPLLTINRAKFAQ